MPKLVLGFHVLVLALLSGGTTVFGGGDEIGNGGHGLECLVPGAASYRSLDAYEAEHKHQLFPELNETTGDEFERAASALKRLERLDPERTKRYLNVLSFFKQHSKLVPSIELPRINDAGRLHIPENCRLTQTIIQLQQPVDGTVFFLISQAFWTALSAEDRVILIMHEAIYWDSIRHHGHTDSAPSRRLNAALFSNEIVRLDANAYRDLLNSLRLDVISWDDPEEQFSWTLSREDFPSQDAAAAFCAKAQMHLLTVDIGRFSGVFDRFRFSSLGRYHFEGRTSTYLWLDESNKALSLEGPLRLWSMGTKTLPGACAFAGAEQESNDARAGMADNRQGRAGSPAQRQPPLLHSYLRGTHRRRSVDS